MPRKRANRGTMALLNAFIPRPPKRRRTGPLKSSTITPQAPRARSKAAVGHAAGGPKRKPATKTRKVVGQGTWHHLRFTGVAGSRGYRVYMPPGLRRTTRAPLVVALHGCGQDARDFAVTTRFNELAAKHGFVVAYPEQPVTQNGHRCWNWFRTGHQRRGRGEPAILAGIVGRLLRERVRWRIDPERIYVTGFSAGGAMAVVLGATYPELFAAIGVHSAPPYRSAASPATAIAAMHGRAVIPPVESAAARALPPMIIFQGTFDGTVRQVNGRRVADQWLAARANAAGPARAGGPVAPAMRPARVARTSPARPFTAKSRRGYTVDRWYAGGRKVLELWVVDGLGHAWSGGSTKGSYSDARGPRASTEMWKFFSTHRAIATVASARAG